MVSAAMEIQDQSGGSQSNGVLRTVKRVPLDGASHPLNTVHPKEQFSSGNDYALKVRKPYTITKQRERWTEEEHNKFIEALKLYGRSWRRIEEHVGTKTAVQIRSHAQKFFSKVVRQSSNADASSVKPIEIPPPRPKRKPAHPYPRKLVSPLKTGTSVLEQQTRSASPNSYTSDQENQSPTSVLSAIGSEMLGTTDSNTPNGSQSPVSSADSFLVCEPNSSPEEVGSPTRSSADEEAPMDLELFPQDKAIIEEGSVEAVSTRSFKLFGKNVLLTDSQKLNEAICESPQPSDMSEGKRGQSLPLEFPGMSMEERWNPPSGVPAPFYYMQFPNENPNPAYGVSGPTWPWWGFCGNVPFASFPLHDPVPVEGRPSFVCRQTQDREVQKEGSRTGSNTGSLNTAGDGDRNSDVETQSRRISSEEEENEQKPNLWCKPSENLSFSEQRMALDKCLKGFVPYKRRLADRETESSTIASDEREDQRIRIALDKCLEGFVPYKRCLAERETQSSTIASNEREDQRIRLCL